MIRHCVFIRFRDDVVDTYRAAIYDDLTKLRDELTGIDAVACGVNSSPEFAMDKGYSEGFIVDFHDAGARDRYLVHPTHIAIGARIVQAALGGVDGVMVFDLAID